MRGKLRWKALSEKRHRKVCKRKVIKRSKNASSQMAQAITVRAPKKIQLDFLDDHYYVTKFLSDLRRRVRDGEEAILIDFSQTNSIIAGGGILMYSELQRLKDLYPRVRFFCRESRKNQVNQVLQYLNIYKMLGHSSRVVPRRSDVVNWRHARADDIDCTGAGQIIEAYASLSQPTAKLLFKAASEAISNAVMHAYDNSRGDGLPDPRRKSWWMFCREFENKFVMSVCDLGVGIPGTLTVKNADEIVSKILEKISFGNIPNDAQMILGAMEYARTRTRRPQQGKGLMDLRKIIDKMGTGKLYVFSNKGCVFYDVKNGYQTQVYRKSIRGTVIVWSVPLQAEVAL